MTVYVRHTMVIIITGLKSAGGSTSS